MVQAAVNSAMARQENKLQKQMEELREGIKNDVRRELRALRTKLTHKIDEKQTGTWDVIQKFEAKIIDVVESTNQGL